MSFQCNRWSIVICCFLTLLCVDARVSSAGKSGLLTPDILSIQGRWVRSDAPYVIELTQGKDGQLQSTYFNRKLIHVEKTETTQKNGLLYVMILLQDVNYQGSAYLLSYDRTKDALNGIYFHAASKKRFEVDFVRKTVP